MSFKAVSRYKLKFRGDRWPDSSVNSKPALFIPSGHFFFNINFKNLSIIYRQKNEQIRIVQLDDFSQSEHIHLTGIQSEKQEIPEPG